MFLFRSHRKPDLQDLAALHSAPSDEGDSFLGDSDATDRNPTASRVSFAADPKFKCDQPTVIDAGLYLDGICKLYQTASPDYRIDWVVKDNAAGMVSEAVCRVLGFALCEIIAATEECARVEQPAQSTISIVLRRRGTIVLCAIASPWLTRSTAGAPSVLWCTDRMGAALGNTCIIRLMPERGLLAILLDVQQCEARIPAAISAYRLARAGYHATRWSAAHRGRDA